MIAEILSVGTELLLGQITNTDAQYIARELSVFGINQYYQATVGDNMGRFKACLDQAWQRSDIVITTGGLGPTMDDLTKEGVAEYLGLPLEEHAESRQRLESFFASLGRTMTPNNLKQVQFPVGARILRNDHGTAPGAIVEKDGKAIIILPGPPNELLPMFETGVKPYLMERSGEEIHSRVLRFYGIGESALEDRLQDLIKAQQNPTIAPYAGYGEVTLRLTAKVQSGENAMAMLDDVEKQVVGRVGEFLYGYDDDSLASVVVQTMTQQGQTLSVAESCTGGMIADRLISVPGASAVFLGGYVCYHNDAKMRDLGVSGQTIVQYGAVSEQCAREMAEGVRKRTGSDYGLAVTGIAGPDGGTAEKPVGLVYIALASPQGTKVRETHQTRDRQRIRMMSAMTAIDMVRMALK